MVADWGSPDGWRCSAQVRSTQGQNSTAPPGMGSRRSRLPTGRDLGAGLAAGVYLHARDLGVAGGRSPAAGAPHLRPRAGLAAAAPSLAGVAPATVVTADDDPAAEDVRRYASRLREAGVEVEEVRYRHLTEHTDGP